MVIKTQSDAARLAVEMEKRAIRIYERALMLAEDSSAQVAIRGLLTEEGRHLVRFTALLNSYQEGTGRNQLLVQSAAADILFSGGVMEMERTDSLSSMESVYAFAAENEAQAAERYELFAKSCPDPMAADVFEAIAAEERTHLMMLKKNLELVRNK